MKQSLRYRGFISIGLLLIGLFLSLLVSEIILGALFPTGYFVWEPNLNNTFKPHPDVMPGIHGKSRFVINSQGIRGEEFSPEQTYRILAIGGSTTECLFLDQSEAWPYLLQRTLDETTLNNQEVWVGNVGRSGQTTRHHILEMRYLLPQYPKVDAVVMLIGVNDLLVRLAQDVNYQPNFMDRVGSEEQLIPRTFSVYPEESLPFYKGTAIWRLARRVKSVGLSLFVQDETGTFQEDDGAIYITWREHRRNASATRNTLPDLDSALDEYSRNINTIIDLAEKHSVRLILVTQPSIWNPDLSKEATNLLWMGGISDYQREMGHEYYSVEALEHGMKMYNEVLLEACQTRGVECINLASILPKDTTVFYDDVHFNESGSKKAADALAEYMLQHAPFRELDEITEIGDAKSRVLATTSL